MLQNLFLLLKLLANTTLMPLLRKMQDRMHADTEEGHFDDDTEASMLYDAILIGIACTKGLASTAKGPFVQPHSILKKN